MAENDKKYLSRDAILNANDIETEEVSVPEWGGVVLVRGMTGAQRDQYQAETTEYSAKISGRGKKGADEMQLKMKNATSLLVAMCMVDENGKQLFSLRDVEALGDKSAKALDRVFAAAQRLSAVSDEDIKSLIKN